MKPNKIAASAEDIKNKLFGQNAINVLQEQPILDRFAVYQEHVGKTVMIPIEHIVIEDNVRKNVDTHSQKFLDLVASIKRDGLLQNLVVELRNGESGTYLSCVSGQRRLLAAKEAEIKKATCLIKNYTVAERVSTGLTENLLRQDLHCIDIADGYAALYKEGLSKEEIAERFERNTRTIHKYLLIASWPDDVRETMRKNPDIFTTRVIFNNFISRNFQTEKALRKEVETKLRGSNEIPQQHVPSNHKTSSPVASYCSDLSSNLSISIKHKGNNEKGTISFNYKTPAELEIIINFLKSGKL